MKIQVRRAWLRWLLLSPLCLLAYYGLMRWFHSSWATTEPVLGVLTPLVLAAASLGRAWQSFFSQPQISSVLLVGLFVAALVGTVRRKGVSGSVLVLALGALGASQIALGTGRIQLFYLIYGLALATLFAGLLSDRDGYRQRDDVPHPVVWVGAVVLIAP